MLREWRMGNERMERMENAWRIFESSQRLHDNKLHRCLSVALTITNGPQDTTVCINQVANCTCGFTGADPNLVVPNWNIIKRNRKGAIVTNETVSGSEIFRSTNDGLEWIADPLNGNNSVLRVGPDQSSYQCFIVLLNGIIENSIGTLTVVGKLDSGIDQ